MSSREPIDVTAYHERTKHRFDRYARGPDSIDWDAQPDSFRRYAGAPLITLPLAADALTLPYSALYADAPIAAQPMGLESVAVLLEISLALSAWKQYGSARWSLRCNPSSGNLHPTEAYLVASGIAGLADGLYHYRADEHALELRCRFAATEGAETPPALLLGLSSVHWREAWKYGERAYRYCQLDVGHAIAAVNVAAATLGWKLTPHDGLDDEQLGRLLGVDRSADFTAAEAEQPDLLVSIHTPESTAVAPERLLQRMTQGIWSGKANVLDPQHHYEWPVIEQVAEACRRPPQAPREQAHHDDLPPPLPSPCSEPAAKLFRRRRSAQAFDAVTAMGQADFYRLLDHLLPRPGSAPWESLPWPARIHPMLFVHRVEGLSPGLYALPRRRDALALLKREMREDFLWSEVDGAPPHLPLYRLVSARAERTAATLSCRQPIAGDSAFSLAMLAEFGEEVSASPWRYRERYREAGAVGQLLYLEAEASALQGTGIGCFFDDEVHKLLGIEGNALQSLYHFTVGGALTDSRIISLPPYERNR
jgi:SagB-type dehydrogenase family enzyme